jgi:hypothetical protein
LPFFAKHGLGIHADLRFSSGEGYDFSASSASTALNVKPLGSQVTVGRGLQDALGIDQRLRESREEKVENREDKECKNRLKRPIDYFLLSTAVYFLLSTFFPIGAFDAVSDQPIL